MRDLSQNEMQAYTEGRLHIDPNRLVGELEKLGEEWAKLDAAASLLEETKGSVLGQMVQAGMSQGNSATASEHGAKASAMYRQHLTHMVEARKVALIAKVRYEAHKTFIDLYRTNQANQRAEMKLGSIQT